MQKSVSGLLAFFLFVLVGAGIYFFLSPNLKKNGDIQPSEQPSPQQTPSPRQSPAGSQQIISKTQTENAIKTNVNAGNFLGLVPYATKPTVSYTIMSSECCEPQNPETLTQKLETLQDALPLDFNQNAESVKNLKSKNPQLAEAYIGISTKGEQLAAFYIDDQNLISSIQLSVSWKLYTY